MGAPAVVESSPATMKTVARDALKPFSADARASARHLDFLTERLVNLGRPLGSPAVTDKLVFQPQKKP